MATVQDALEVDNFRRSDEASVAESLFDAYRSGDASAVRTLLDAKCATPFCKHCQAACRYRIHAEHISQTLMSPQHRICRIAFVFPTSI